MYYKHLPISLMIFLFFLMASLNELFHDLLNQPLLFGPGIYCERINNTATNGTLPDSSSLVFGAVEHPLLEFYDTIMVSLFLFFFFLALSLSLTNCPSCI